MHLDLSLRASEITCLDSGSKLNFMESEVTRLQKWVISGRQHTILPRNLSSAPLRRDEIPSNTLDPGVAREYSAGGQLRNALIRRFRRCRNYITRYALRQRQSRRDTEGSEQRLFRVDTQRGPGLPASSPGRSFWLLGCVRLGWSFGALGRAG